MLKKHYTKNQYGLSADMGPKDAMSELIDETANHLNNGNKCIMHYS